MTKTDWPFPMSFGPANQSNKVLALTKTKLWKNFRWSKDQCLYDAMKLAFLLHAFNRDDEAMEVCQAIGQISFGGTFNLWLAVELALTFQSRLLRQPGDIADADACLARVPATGFLETRLEGNMLDRNDTLKQALKDGDKRLQQIGRLKLAGELTFIIELGASLRWSKTGRKIWLTFARW